MFCRTDVGLSSEHLFYGVDFVLYCEGAVQEDSSASTDELFWHAVMASHGIKCKCKSVGNKNNVKSIVDKVRNSSINNTIAAMDRDYDDLFGELIDHPNVIYTFGYSWENDVISHLDIDICSALFFDAQNIDDVKSEYFEYQQSQIAALRRACVLDVAYVRAPKALFDREKPMAIIIQQAGVEPRINCANILAGARRIGRLSRVLPASITDALAGDPFLKFYGKAISKLVYYWLVFVSSRFASARKVPFATFMSIAVKTGKFGQTGSPRDVYYSEICGRLSVDAVS